MSATVYSLQYLCSIKERIQAKYYGSEIRIPSKEDMSYRAKRPISSSDNWRKYIMHMAHKVEFECLLSYPFVTNSEHC